MRQGDGALDLEDNYHELQWTVDLEFDQSILIWHIATDLCFHSDSEDGIEREQASNNRSTCCISWFMLPMGIGKIRYLDTCDEVKKFVEKHTLMSSDIRNGNSDCNHLSWARKLFHQRKSEQDQNKAQEGLLKVNTVVPPAKVKEDRSKSVLFDACLLASQLHSMITNTKNRWMLVSNVWVEMPTYPASQCRGTYHAQQLIQGGDVLTHVWLLTAHFGLTEQFQISHGHARARLSAR